MKSIIKRTASAVCAAAMLASLSITSSAASSKPARPSVATRYSSTSNSIRISWKKVKGATGYRVYRLSENKWKPVKNVRSTQFKDTSLAPYTAYRYRVKAFKRTKGKTVWGDISKVKVARTKPLSVPKLTLVSGDFNSVKFKATNAKNVNGYDLDIKKEGVYNFAGNSSITGQKPADYTSIVYKPSKGLDENTTYLFKYRTVVTVNGKNYYSDYSNTVRLTLGKKPSTTTTKPTEPQKPTHPTDPNTCSHANADPHTATHWFGKKTNRDLSKEYAKYAADNKNNSGKYNFKDWLVNVYFMETNDMEWYQKDVVEYSVCKDCGKTVPTDNYIDYTAWQ